MRAGVFISVSCDFGCLVRITSQKGLPTRRRFLLCSGKCQTCAINILPSVYGSNRLSSLSAGLRITTGFNQTQAGCTESCYNFFCVFSITRSSKAVEFPKLLNCLTHSNIPHKKSLTNLINVAITSVSKGVWRARRDSNSRPPGSKPYIVITNYLYLKVITGMPVANFAYQCWTIHN